GFLSMTNSAFFVQLNFKDPAAVPQCSEIRSVDAMSTVLGYKHLTGYWPLNLLNHVSAWQDI
ncbi:MAG TPA: hypothetical protein PLX72_10100, partial [Candidatus Syntrophosphaera sp.]|nr:hypothetical protein [Candidatus Syntrophosphaera sp.]